jgi:integrase
MESIAETYAHPNLGSMLVQDIDLSDILDVLRPIWETKTATATKLRQILEGTLAFAAVNGWRAGGNPALWKGNLALVLGAPSKIGCELNYPALRLDDAARWWSDLKAREGMGAAALRFQARTATRTGAVRFATWGEFDLDRAVWTIQPGRTAAKIPKRDRARRAILTADGVAFLRALPRRAGSDYVFWAPRGGPLSDATIGKVMRVMHQQHSADGGPGYADEASGLPAVPHGLRSTFRTWVSERTHFDSDMAEIALFHRVGTKVQRAYDRTDMLEKRRAMMMAWEAFLAGAGSVAVGSDYAF